ncbi:hypothetical protein MGSAQ_003030 [marine sediment metagenome]|uniref:Uncharacterized protein n=1 Tax=marine sediment metagenome TaxID=412755 RepID=A0A1B6NPY7_9ZZZZ
MVETYLKPIVKHRFSIRKRFRAIATNIRLHKTTILFKFTTSSTT